MADPQSADGTTEERANARKVREGLVVSDGMDATVVVQRTKKLYVHDQENTAKVGDRVRVIETRPLSKLKRWRLAEVLERAR
jgi:small subunit ribosomal protein S17